MNKKYEGFLIIWVIVLALNQIFIFANCFYIECIIPSLPHTALITFLFLFFLREEEFILKYNENIIQSRVIKIEYSKKKEDNKENDNDTLLPLGIDPFEKYIGKKFENQGDVVIYNSYIDGYNPKKDIDLIRISTKEENINFVEWKYVDEKTTFTDIKNIYTKISKYKHISLKENNNSIKINIENINQKIETYKIVKTLYISYKNIINVNILEELTMINPNLYKYKDMKIVILHNEIWEI